MMFNYDQAYSEPGYYWGKTPNRLCARAAECFTDPKGKRAVDLGCGEGRDMIYLAKAGFDVTGVDISLPGLQKAERWAAEEGLTVRTVQASLLDYRPAEEFDLIYGSGTLSYLPAHLRADFFEHFKARTPAGGIHAFNVFVEKPFIATPPDWGVAEYFFRSGELLGYYWDWEILAVEEFIFDCNSSGVPHRHAMDVVIARKI
jgi:tellurite methyltransferase